MHVYCFVSACLIRIGQLAGSCSRWSVKMVRCLFNLCRASISARFLTLVFTSRRLSSDRPAPRWLRHVVNLGFDWEKFIRAGKILIIVSTVEGRCVDAIVQRFYIHRFDWVQAIPGGNVRCDFHFSNHCHYVNYRSIDMLTKYVSGTWHGGGCR